MNWRTVTLTLCSVLLLPVFSRAQNLPAAPPAGVRDDTRALTEGARAELERKIAISRQDLGADIWLNADTFLPEGKTLGAHARQLRQSWSPDRDAVLASYDRASDTMAVTLSPGMWRRYSAAEIVSLIRQSLKSVSQKGVPLETRLTQTMGELLQNLKTLEQSRQTSLVTLSRHHLKLAAAYVPVLAVGAVSLLVLGTLTRRKLVREACQTHFPTVSVGTRFGALHGGGIHATSLNAQLPPH